MGESFSVKAILSAKDVDFVSTVKNAMKATENLGSKLKSGFNFGFIAGAGQKAFSVLTTGASDLVSEINSSNAAWKTFEGNMGMLGKSKKDINGVKNEMQKFAEQTIYSSSDMATTYAQLAAVGVKDTAKLVKGFGGLAAAAENPQQAMKTLSTQATQMAAKPKVAWADFKLMLEQSPAGISAVAKELGYTSKELVALVQDTKGAGLATDKFLKAIAKVGTNKAFSKLATEPKTVGQAMDGLKEAVGNKLIPAFDILSQKGISAIDSIANKLAGVDASQLATKISTAMDKAIKFISSAVNTAKKYWNVLKTSFDGVGGELLEAFNAVKDGLGRAFNSGDSVKNFGTTMDSVANAIKKVANFIEEHGDAIGKAIPWIVQLGIAFKGISIVNSVVPGLGLFTKSIATLAGKGIGAIAGKLFGISGAQKQVGSSSAKSAKQMLASAKAFALMGVAVLAIAIGFAILAQSSIALASAGPAAIGTMAGLVIALAGLGYGMAMVLKTLAPMGKKLMPVATAMLVMSAAVVVVAVGFALLAFSAISLAKAGPAAIGTMAGLLVALGLLGVGMVVLTKTLAPMAGQLMAVAVAMVVLGAAVIVIAAGFALLAFTAISLANAGPAAIAVMFGLIAAIALLAVGAAVLGPALTAGSVGFLAFGAAILMVGLGALLAATALVLVSTVLPIIVAYGLQGAISIAALGASMYIFAAGATAAGIACVVLGAGLVVAATGLALVGAAVLVAAVSVLVLAASIVVLSAGVLLLGASLTLVGVALATIATLLPLTAVGALMLSASFAAMLALSALLGATLLLISVPLALIGPAAIAAGAGMIVFGAGLIVASAGALILGAGLKLVNSSMKSIAKNAQTTKKSLSSMQKSVKLVSSGLDAVGNKAKSAMNKLKSAFDNTANKAKSAGKKVGTGFTNGMKSGLNSAPSKASSIVKKVNAKFKAGRTSAYASGAFISIGFAQGMLSQMAIIQAAANKMVAAADKAIRAKAKIHSPADLTDELGSYFGQGWVNGILGMVRNARIAAEKLVAIPEVQTPSLANAFGGELSADYDYYRNANYTIEVPLEVDGKRFAKATAIYTQEELDKNQARNSRKQGKV